MSTTEKREKPPGITPVELSEKEIQLCERDGVGALEGEQMSVGLFGLLFRLKAGNPILIEILAMEEERERAKLMAKVEMTRLDWSGPKQAMFMHRDGSVEVWGLNDLRNES